MGGVDAWGSTTQKFHLLGTVECTNNTTQYLELTSLSTSYAAMEFVFTGWINHAGAGTNIGSGQFTEGPSIQMQGAWPGGPDSGACFYRSINGVQYDSTPPSLFIVGWVTVLTAVAICCLQIGAE